MSSIRFLDVLLEYIVFGYIDDLYLSSFLNDYCHLPNVEFSDYGVTPTETNNQNLNPISADVLSKDRDA